VQGIATAYQPRTPELDRTFLEREAAEGLPVRGMKRTWDSARPTVLPANSADKVGLGAFGWGVNVRKGACCWWEGRQKGALAGA
jgi:hypothetical protein